MHSPADERRSITQREAWLVDREMSMMPQEMTADWGPVRRGLNYIVIGVIIPVLAFSIFAVVGLFFDTDLLRQAAIVPLVTGVVLVCLGYIHFLFAPTRAVRLLARCVFVAWVIALFAGLSSAAFVALVAVVAALSASSLIVARIAATFRKRNLHVFAKMYTQLLTGGAAVVALLTALLESKQLPIFLTMTGLSFAFIAQFFLVKQARDAIAIGC